MVRKSKRECCSYSTDLDFAQRDAIELAVAPLYGMGPEALRLWVGGNLKVYDYLVPQITAGLHKSQNKEDTVFQVWGLQLGTFNKKAVFAQLHKRTRQHQMC